jgi:hypothetical protein
MSDLRKNLTFAKTLIEIPLWPVVGFICLMFVSVFVYFVILHVSYVPKHLELIQGESAFEVRMALNEAMGKIIYTFSVWLLVLLLITSQLVYMLWRSKRFVNHFLGGGGQVGLWREAESGSIASIEGDK